MAPFHYMLKAPSVSNLDVIEHITVYLTSYSWKQSRILCYACCLQGAIYSFMTGSAEVRNQSLIAFIQSVDAQVHYTLHPPTPCIPLQCLFIWWWKSVTTARWKCLFASKWKSGTAAMWKYWSTTRQLLRTWSKSQIRWLVQQKKIATWTATVHMFGNQKFKICVPDDGFKYW